MSFKFNISEILNQLGEKKGEIQLSEWEIKNLVRLFEYTNYLYDDEENLTKTFNLVKKAREKLYERIEEMFEADLFEEPLEMVESEEIEEG